MMIATGGRALVVDEERLLEANRRGRDATGLDVCATGTAGLAGLLKVSETSGATGEQILLFTGAER